MRVGHVITGLGVGGAEMALLRLVERLERQGIENVVTSLRRPGPVGDRLWGVGAPVRTLGMRRGLPSPLAVPRLAAWLRRDHVDVVQTWTYHADLVGGLAGRLAGLPVAWNLRNTTLDPATSRPTTRCVVRACALLSRSVPSGIVANSHAAVAVHARWGYDTDRCVVIPNGFDVETLRPDPAARPAVRDELGLPADALLVGAFARRDPQKDFPTLISAAARLRREVPGAVLLVAGEGVTGDEITLVQGIRGEGLVPGHDVLLLGPRDDTARLMAACDLVTTSSSSGEGFPQVVGEAMACAVPCVVTDVGDSALVVGDTGRVVPASDPAALAAAWVELLRLPAEERRALGQRARRRVAERFAMDGVTARYVELHSRLTAPSA